MTEINFKISSCQFRKYRRPLLWSSLVQQCLDIDNTIILSPYKFSLQASVDHHGNTIHCGHYTASVSSVEKTFYCDDDRITQCNTIDTRNSSTAYLLSYKLRVECPRPDRGKRESFNPHGAGTLVYPFNDRSRNSHWDLWDRQCVSSWWPLDWVDTDTNCTLIYDLFLKVWLMGCATCIYLYWLMGKGVAYVVVCPFRALVGPYRKIWLLTFSF